MDIRHEFHGDTFIWDAEKAETNWRLKKRGVPESLIDEVTRELA
jgi:hypothetical protein